MIYVQISLYIECGKFDWILFQLHPTSFCFILPLQFLFCFAEYCSFVFSIFSHDLTVLTVIVHQDFFILSPVASRFKIVRFDNFISRIQKIIFYL